MNSIRIFQQFPYRILPRAHPLARQRLFTYPLYTTAAMSEYMSTLEGFQRAMKWSLTGPPEDSKSYAEATTTPTFYQLMNGQRLSYDVYVQGIVEWRAKISDYEPVV